jgi:hypothetical protein
VDKGRFRPALSFALIAFFRDGETYHLDKDYPQVSVLVQYKHAARDENLWTLTQQ